MRSIVETLVLATRDMEENNSRLEQSLKASKQEINQLQINLEAVRNESLTDPLTSLANRKYFDQALDKFIAQSVANGEPMALLLTDIDHFKAFNDTFGHLTGDQVLRLVALAVKQNVKGQDVAARYGGEEFAIILPGTTLRAALTVADHIRRAVMTKELMKRSTGEHLGRVTVSIGVAVLHKRRDRAGPDRARRQLPLYGQALRAQSRDVRDRPGGRVVLGDESRLSASLALGLPSLLLRPRDRLCGDPASLAHRDAPVGRRLTIAAEHEQADRRREISLLAFLVDLRDQLRQRLVALVRDLLQRAPEGSSRLTLVL